MVLESKQTLTRISTKLTMLVSNFTYDHGAFGSSYSLADISVQCFNLFENKVVCSSISCRRIIDFDRHRSKLDDG